MTVSVIIPARNAGESLAATLDSLRAQQWSDWRAIIIDDGSTDATRAIAAHYATRDNRLAVIDGPGRGVGAARNAGLAALGEGQAAPGEDWLLFLDADDTLDPAMLERMMATLAANPAADAVHCGWVYTTISGEPLSQRRCEDAGADLFPLAATTCPFAIHACVFRRALLERAGLFDESLTTSEDFDLWQRLARVGAHFVALPEYLVTYRLREQQSWFDARRFLADALEVVGRGHRPDPRLSGQDLPPSHAEGMGAESLYSAQLQMVVWAGGMLAARGEDATALLASLPASSHPLLEPDHIAATLIRAVPMVACGPVTLWFERWPLAEPRLTAFLAGLEAHSGAADLTIQVMSALELAIAREALSIMTPERPVAQLATTAALRIEARGEVVDLALPGIERAVCHILDGGAPLGSLVLPVFGGVLAAGVLADAIAARFAWPLLGSLLITTVYEPLLDPAAGEPWAYRRALLLDAEPPAADSAHGALHDRIGWTVLLQELLGAPELSLDQPPLQEAPQLADPDLAASGPEARDPDLGPPQGLHRRAANLREAVELSAGLPTFTDVERPLLIDLTLGGAPAASVELSPEAGTISDRRVQAAVCEQGIELARVAVREAIVLYHGDLALSLRERLRDRAGTLAALAQDTASGPNATAAPAHDLAAAARRDLPPGALLIGPPPGFAASATARRAELPLAVAEAMIAHITPPLPVWRTGDGTVTRAFVLPELGFGPASAADPHPSLPAAPADPADDGTPARYGRHHFERLFLSGADPWQYSSAYEQHKYEQTLALLPPDKRSKVLEIGCAEGHFTRQLAPLVETLLATDIADLALERAAARCADLGNISYTQLDILKDDLAGHYQTIFCCELLYYMGGLEQLQRVGAKIAAALEPDGVLITAHANLVVDDPASTGFDWTMPYGGKRIGETFAQVPELVFEQELVSPLYRIQLFRKRRQPGLLARLFASPAAPSITPIDYAEPEPEVAAHVLWQGGQVAPSVAPVVTERLPILMYHAVADHGPAPLARWRVTPAMFEGQLRYLRDAGFRSASFAEWRAAREERRPLPGRRVIITFDDIYADFERHALPLLQRYGFPATLFVPSGKLGGRADWDAWSGEALPLIDLEGLKRARDAGMQLGAHGASHRQLAGIPAREVLDELWHSRAALEQALEVEIDALAYPSGSFDDLAEHLATACFYRHAVTTTDALSTLDERDLALSRIEVRGGTTLAEFIARMPE